LTTESIRTLTAVHETTKHHSKSSTNDNTLIRLNLIALDNKIQESFIAKTAQAHFTSISFGKQSFA